MTIADALPSDQPDPGEPDDQDVEAADDSGDEQLPTIEQKYQDQMRQIVTQKIELPVTALLAMLKEQIQLNPDFQRRGRWNVQRQSRFIESLIMNVPLPPVFLGEDDYGKYVVLDGRQRLTATAKFLSNDLKLSRLKVWSELNGMTYQEMVKRGYDKYVVRRFIPAVVILKESSAVVKYDVFDRLNTGGVQANDMEIRNAVYRGPFTQTLHSLSRLPDFCSLWGIPTDVLSAEKHSTYSQMDDLLYALRFFALREHDTMNLKFKDFLSDFMLRRNRRYSHDQHLKSDDEKAFRITTSNCWRIFGRDAFTKTSGGPRSAPLADALMVALAELPPQRIDDAMIQAVRTAKQRLLSDGVFLKAITAGTNGRTAIAHRVEMARQSIRALLA